MDLSNVNFLAVLVAAVVSFMLGALWYGPLFGKAWQAELGFTDEDLKEGNMAKTMGTSFVLILVMALGMGILLHGHGPNDIDLQSGIIHGLFVGLLFVGTSMGINYVYEKKSIKLWLINAGYQIIYLSMMGAILGAWR